MRQLWGAPPPASLAAALIAQGACSPEQPPRAAASAAVRPAGEDRRRPGAGRPLSAQAIDATVPGPTPPPQSAALPQPPPQPPTPALIRAEVAARPRRRQPRRHRRPPRRERAPRRPPPSRRPAPTCRPPVTSTPPPGAPSGQNAAPVAADLHDHRRRRGRPLRPRRRRRLRQARRPPPAGPALRPRRKRPWPSRFHMKARRCSPLSNPTRRLQPSPARKSLVAFRPRRPPAGQGRRGAGSRFPRPTPRSPPPRRKRQRSLAVYPATVGSTERPSPASSLQDQQSVAPGTPTMSTTRKSCTGARAAAASSRHQARPRTSPVGVV